MTSLSEEIWTAKYRFVPPAGSDDKPDVDYAATIDRVARALADTEAECDREHWSERFADAMRDFRFMPAGRIIAGAGTGRDVTLFNCFVMGTIPDDLGGIFDHLREAYRASAELAEEKGTFPLWDAAMLETPNLKGLDDETRSLIAKRGLRNGCLTSIAPTGTTSLLAGNVSSGIEPVFAYSYERRILGPDGEPRFEPVVGYGLKCWREAKGDAPPPADVFVSAQTLTPADHLAMQAAAQSLIDSSISKTVNCPEDIDFNQFADIYVEGYHLGCKGLTTYRPNAVTGSVLSVTRTEPKHDPLPELSPRAERLSGATYKLKWPDSAHAVYVTINDIGEGEARRPFEMFINSKNMEHYAWTLALTRMVSAVFRRGGDVSFVAEELKAVFDPRGGVWMQGRYVPSLLAAIGDIVARHLGQLPPADAESFEAHPRQRPATTAAACPQCGSSAMIKAEGCLKCTDCGYLKCG